jgi:ABC-type branched-subunit amino acid transport system ATPase component
MLHIRNLHVYYGLSQALYDVSLEVKKGEIVAILGRNGAGKTTLMKTVIGFVKPKQGVIAVNGQNVIDWTPEKRALSGIAYVPDNKRLFPQLTVWENLSISAIGARIKFSPESGDSILGYFPKLNSLLQRKASTLSGGEQQMVALARALLRKPHIVLLDEPSQGLAPLVVDSLKKAILAFKNESKTSFLVVEQEIKFATEVAERIYGLLTGSVVYEGNKKDFLATQAFRKFLTII